MNKTAKARVAEARAQLWKMSRELFHDEEYANATIDAFEQAVRADTLQPRAQAPEVAEAERIFRDDVRTMEFDDYHPKTMHKHAVAIAAELDRLRAEVARLEGERETYWQGDAGRTVYAKGPTATDAIMDLVRLGKDGVNEAIDELAAAVRAEAFQEMRAEAERRFQARADMEPGHAVAYGRLADWAEQQAEKARGK